MPEKSMKEKLTASELVLCINLRLARSIDIAMVAKAGGYDALYVDMQHAPYSIKTTATICSGVDPVRWTPFHLRRRCHQCRRVIDPTHRSSGVRWLI